MAQKKNIPQNTHQSLTQNNINIYQTVIKDLHGLSYDKQDKIISMLEKVTDHNIDMEKGYLQLEQQNMSNNTNEIPYIRQYSFKGQNLALLTVAGSIVASLVFGFIGMEKINRRFTQISS